MLLHRASDATASIPQMPPGGRCGCGSRDTGTPKSDKREHESRAAGSAAYRRGEAVDIRHRSAFRQAAWAHS